MARKGQTDNGRYIGVVCSDNSGAFSANALRFDTPDDAREYISGLAVRWTSVRSYAVIPHDTAKDAGGYWSRNAIEKAAVGTIVDY